MKLIYQELMLKNMPSFHSHFPRLTVHHSFRPFSLTLLFISRSETGSLSSATQGYNTAADHCDPLHAQGHSHAIFDHSVHHDVASHSSLRSLLLLFALSLHSVSFKTCGSQPLIWCDWLRKLRTVRVLSINKEGSGQVFYFIVRW